MRKLLEVGKTSYSHLGIYGRAFGGGSFIISYRINDHKREEEIVRSSLFYSLKLKICYLLKRYLKAKELLFLKLVRIIRAQKKNTRIHNKSQSATITQNQEASSLNYKPNPPKLPNTNTLFPYSPNSKKHS